LQKNLQKRILRIEDDGGSSSSGSDLEGDNDNEEKERTRWAVQQKLKERRRQLQRRTRKAQNAKPVMELGVDSETDEENEAMTLFDPSYGLSKDRLAQLSKLFTLVDLNKSDCIYAYELGILATQFFRQLKDEILRRDAEELMEEIDIDKSGSINREEFLSYMSLIVSHMKDENFLPIYHSILERYEDSNPAESDFDMMPGERLVKLQDLFLIWDSKNTGAVSRDLVSALARACEPLTNKDPASIVAQVPEVVERKDFIAACILVGLHSITDQAFDGLIDSLLVAAH